jgi:CRP-like cAMP-binding protein/cytochrome P450
MKPALSREAAAPFVRDMIEMVEARSRALPDGGIISVLEFVERLTVDQLSLAASGTPMPDEAYHHLERFAKTFVGSSVAGQPEFFLRLPGYKKSKAAFHQYISDAVEEHEYRSSNPAGRPDLMDIVARAAYANGCPFNEADRVANGHLPYANGFIYAGRICATMLYALLKHPSILKSVQTEIDDVFGEGIPTLKNLRRMTVLHNCIKETHRRYPVAPAVPRYAARTFEFAGYTIPRGTYLFLAVVVPHFDERYFADPYKFDPMRFAAPRSEGAQPHAYAPYGLGTHVCLSVGLVETVVMTTVGALLHSLDLELHPPHYELRGATDPVPGPERGFRLRIVGRRQAGTAGLERESESVFPLLNLAADEIARRWYPRGSTIIHQGDAADEFFIVVDGEVEIERTSGSGAVEHLARIGKGGYFGEIGLLHGVPRTATVRASEGGVTVLVISRESFMQMVAEHDLISDEIAEMAKRRMMVSQLADALPGLDSAALTKVSTHLERQRFAPGQVVIQQGDEADRFYVVVAGNAEVVNHHPGGDDIVLAMLGPGEYFGEIGILHNRPRTATVRAVGNVNLEVLSLAREHFLALSDSAHQTGQAIADKALRRLLALSAM